MFVRDETRAVAPAVTPWVVIIDDGFEAGVWAFADAGRLARLVDPVDQLPLVVGLQHPQVIALGQQRPAVRFHVVERVAPVDVRLTLAQQVQVGPVQQEDGLGHVRSAPFVTGRNLTGPGAKCKLARTLRG